MHNIDPSSPQKWSQLLAAMISTGCRKGWLFSAETGAKAYADNDPKRGYIPINFGPPPVREDMPEKQASKFE